MNSDSLSDEVKNLGVQSPESQATSMLSAAPSKVSVVLDDEQLALVKSLYEGHTPESNSGIMFGVLGEAYIDERMKEYGTTEFRWLNSDQYKIVRAAVLKALALTTKQKVESE